MTKRCYVFDIDGVLADTTNILLPRSKTKELGFNLNSKKYKDNEIDWDYFSTYMDKATPIEGILTMFVELAKHNKVFLLTGRLERDKTKTIKWLKDSIVELFGNTILNTINWELIMRPIDCIDSQIKYKEGQLIEIMNRGYDIMFMIEDNPAMIDKLTKMEIIGLKSPKEYIDLKDKEIKAIHSSEIIRGEINNPQVYYVNSLGEKEDKNG